MRRATGLLLLLALALTPLSCIDWKRAEETFCQDNPNCAGKWDEMDWDVGFWGE